MIIANDSTFFCVVLSMVAHEYVKIFWITILRKATTSYGGNPVDNKSNIPCMRLMNENLCDKDHFDG